MLPAALSPVGVSPWAGMLYELLSGLTDVATGDAVYLVQGLLDLTILAITYPLKVSRSSCREP